MDIDSDRTSLNTIIDKLLNGEADEGEQEAAGQFLLAILPLAEGAMSFSGSLKSNEWIEVEENNPFPDIPLNQRN